MFELERRMLEARGHTVEVFQRQSDEIRTQGLMGLLRGGVATPWNFKSFRHVRELTERFEPEIVHVHNTFPLISPSVFAGVGVRAAKVFRLPNYRILCPAGIPLREGRSCTECIDTRSVRPALRFGCYRQSRLATLPVAMNVALHRRLGTWQRDVDAFVVLSDFQREIMVEAGLPRALVHVKPNFLPGIGASLPWAKRANRAVFVGRLGAEKGIADLITAWLSWGNDAPELVVIGDGPLRAEVEKKVFSAGVSTVRFTGKLQTDEAQRYIAESRLLILPSVCYETFGLVLVESLAKGTPCAVSSIGPLPDIVREGKAGISFRPGDPMDLLKRVRDLWRSPERHERMSEQAIEEFERQFNEDVNYDRLMTIYGSAMEVWRSRRNEV